MEDIKDKRKEIKNKNLIKIIIPIIIIILLLGIYLLKRNQDKDIIGDNDDFALEAAEIDIEQLKSYGLPIIIDFGADTCIPCKEMAPVLKELNKELKGKVIVKFVDVWKHPNAAAEFPVELIPTQIFFDKDGNPFMPEDPQAMGMILYSARDTNEHIFTAHQGGMTKEQLMDIIREMGVE